MKCHYCDSEAALDVEKGGVKVWLCERHLRERFRELARADLPEELAQIGE